MNNKTLRTVMTTTAMLLAAAFLAACGTGHLAKHIHSAAAKSGCVTSAIHWYYKEHGKSQLHDLRVTGTAVLEAGKAAGEHKFSPSTTSQVAAATTSFDKAITALDGNLPPQCVTGVDAKLKPALAQFTLADKAELAAVKAARSKNVDAAQGKASEAGAHAKAAFRLLKATGKALLAYLHI